MPDLRLLRANPDMLLPLAGPLLVIALTLVALIEMIRHRRVLMANIKYLTLFTLVYLILYAGVYLGFPVRIVEEMPWWLIIGGLFVGPLLIYSYGTVGIVRCEQLGIEDMPLLRAAFEGRSIPEHLFGSRYFAEVVAIGVVAPILLLTLASLFGSEPLTGSPWGDGAIAFHTMGLGDAPFLPTFLLAMITVTVGAVAARMGLQNWIAGAVRLRGRYYWIATAIVSLIGAGMSFHPDPTGRIAFWGNYSLCFGLFYLFRRYGLETSLIAHAHMYVCYFAFA